MLLTKTGGWIINRHETGRYTWFPREHGVYVLHSWVNESFPRQAHESHTSLEQTSERRPEQGSDADIEGTTRA